MERLFIDISGGERKSTLHVHLMYRSIAIVGIVATLIVGLSFLHIYHLPLVPSKVLEPVNRVRRLESQCNLQDPFEREYGRTNLRTSRAYEGKSCCRAPTEPIYPRSLGLSVAHYRLAPSHTTSTA
jgi:hypothetical protein